LAGHFRARTHQVQKEGNSTIAAAFGGWIQVESIRGAKLSAGPTASSAQTPAVAETIADRRSTPSSVPIEYVRMFRTGFLENFRQARDAARRI